MKFWFFGSISPSWATNRTAGKRMAQRDADHIYPVGVGRAVDPARVQDLETGHTLVVASRRYTTYSSKPWLLRRKTSSALRTIENATVPAAGVWQIDQSHSDLRIVARHLMVAKVRGTFTDFAGTIVVAENPTESSVEFEAKAASVTTGTKGRDDHLRSPDFLDA